MSSKNKPTQTSRRKFLRDSTMAASSFFIVPRHVLGRGFIAPSDRLTVAAIGAGGKGADDLRNFFGSGKVDVAYLCDVDDRQAAKSIATYSKAKYYKDFREMLDKEHKHFDAVSVSTPDNIHAVAALAAMQLNKHVYVQKPMTHDIYEARTLTEAAKRYKVVAQMGLSAMPRPSIYGPTGLYGRRAGSSRPRRMRYPRS
jgi:Oxidoreductase family, NAD-binding Rossmann fold